MDENLQYEKQKAVGDACPTVTDKSLSITNFEKYVLLGQVEAWLGLIKLFKVGLG